MDRLNGSASLMLVTDLDSTLVDHDDPEDKSLLALNALWESQYRPDSLLVFSTGRSPESYALLRETKPLPTPDILITSVGTEIFHGDSMLSDSAWDELLSRGWDRNVVVQETSRFPALVPQPEMDQRPYKVSFFVDKPSASRIIDALSELLRDRGLDVKIIYSSGTALDVLPRGAGKGRALEYLLKTLESNGKRPVKTLVCGDSGNDAELFGVPGVYGVMVSNAQEELLQWRSVNAGCNLNIILADKRCAAGIIQAIGRFGLGPNVSPRDSKEFLNRKGEIVTPSYEAVKFYVLYEQWRSGEVAKSENHLQDIKSAFYSLGSLIHPSGIEWSVHRCIDAMEKCHGDMKGKRFKVWVDRLSTTQIAKDTWLVKCDKWESVENKRRCCLTTILMSSKVEELNEFVWLHIQQTWLRGSAVKDLDAWLL